MNKTYLYIISAISLLFMSSCEDWLDVSPKTEIKSDDNFESEQGFKDALTGVYLLMSDESLYGKELTFGTTDVLAQYYTGIYQTSHEYYYPSLFDYTDDTSVGIIDAIWLNMYNAIANVNELIAQLESADESMFTGRNYELIKGEAYGLRAFMHFDLARLFGASYAANPSHKAMPYVTSISTTVNPLVSIDDVLQKALTDLVTAQENLTVDPVISTNITEDTDDETYERDRFYKFNYYAVKLLQARIYLYMSDYDNANAAAQEIINQETFTWTPETEIATSDDDSRNYIMSEELIFTLYKSDISDLYTDYFTGTDGGLYMYDENYEGLFELTKSGYYGDYRYTYLTELLSDANARFSSKLKQPSGTTEYAYRIPLMRISEAYYIAAECAVHNNELTDALSYINTVRIQRNLPDDLDASMTSDEVQDEIYKEYAKEFICEGQLYFYFKRLNYQYIPIPSVSGGSITYTNVTPDYIFPMPDDEIEYGGRTDE